MFKQKTSWLFMLLFLFVAEQSHAQLNYLEKGNKLIYFGIHLGFNQGAMKPLRNVSPGSTDSVTFVNSTFGPGFNIGIIGNYQFHKYFDLRLIPTLSFSDRNLIFRDVNNVEVPKTLSSIYLSFPLMFRYKSKPIKDFRMFVLGGIRYDFDLSAKSSRRNADDQILLQTHDVSFETGFGFQF
ncbi:MAG: porin family protein, partial [Chitinophagales bacterium]